MLTLANRNESWPQVPVGFTDTCEMDIANSISASLASASTQGETADAVSLLVLRKALDVQAAGALALINTLPQQPALATEGLVGRNVNVYA